MKIGYADPPYWTPFSKRLYADDERGNEVDHPALIRELELNFPDGWALSASSSSLRVLLPLCPDDCRVAAWVKTFAIYRPGVNPGYCWEPVIFRGGRQHAKTRGRGTPTVRDWVSHHAEVGIFPGCKPPEFCAWLFRLLGLRPGDDLVDLFPGSGTVSGAWEVYCEHYDAHGWEP